MSADERSSLYLRSRSSDSLKPQMVFELFELVGVLRVRPRVSQQFSKGKQACLVFSTISSVFYGAVENEDCRLQTDSGLFFFLGGGGGVRKQWDCCCHILICTV